MNPTLDPAVGQPSNDAASHPCARVLSLVEQLCFKNRTIVSRDSDECYRVLAKELPFKMLRYPSGRIYGTWEVPPAWDIHEAFLSDGKQVLASLKDHLLFVAPYSTSFEGWVSREELLTHVRSNPKQPDHFSYEHRLALNYQMRLKDWGITLPQHLRDGLRADRYFVKIRASVNPRGTMQIADFTLRGKRPETFALLTHLCHPGQANDGLAGVAVGVEIMRRLQARKNRQFTYKLLVMPETIGSAIYLSDKRVNLDPFVGSLFLEMPGRGEHLTCNHSREARSYFDAALHDLCRKEEPNYEESSFGRGMLNDEMNFDWPSIAIPSLTIYRQPFHEYHTSADHPSLLDPNHLEQIVRIVSNFVDTLETDFVPVFAQRGPIYLSRYDLYFDAFKQPELFRFSKDLLYKIDGKRSVYQISRELGIPWADARAYLERFLKLGLLKSRPLPRALLRGDA